MADRAELEVVPFAAEHAEGVFGVILPIQQAEFGIPITRAEQTDLADIPGVYQRGAGQFWVALARGQVVGTIGLLDLGNGTGALRKMFVSAPYRGAPHAAGQRLLDTLLAWARERRLRQVLLGTTARFLAAHRFYEKNGFRQIAPDALPAAFPRLAVDTRFYARTLTSPEATP
jgi:N-acetylglutamate synthase-like GNAT family acetyltransferase